MGPAPTPTWATYWLYVTVIAVLSGETCTPAVGHGQPEPLTPTISTTILSGGCGLADAGEAGTARPASSIAAAVRILRMAVPFTEPKKDKTSQSGSRRSNNAFEPGSVGVSNVHSRC